MRIVTRAELVENDGWKLRRDEDTDDVFVAVEVDEAGDAATDDPQPLERLEAAFRFGQPDGASRAVRMPALVVGGLAHCVRCAPWLEPDFCRPGQVTIDSPVLKEDFYALARVVDARRDRVPEPVLAALAEARRETDHAQALDVLLSALCQATKLPESVADAFNTASIHFGLGSEDWLFLGEEA